MCKKAFDFGGKEFTYSEAQYKKAYEMLKTDIEMLPFTTVIIAGTKKVMKDQVQVDEACKVVNVGGFI